MLDIMVKVSFLFVSFFFFHKKIDNKINIIQNQKGMYFSSSLYYSSKYTKGGSDDGNPFIICMVTPGNVYPGLIFIYLFI